MRDETLTAFNRAKDVFADFTKSYISDDDSPLKLTADTPGDSVGAVLRQEQNNSQKSVSFFSVELNTAQKKYSTFSRELLAI